jgi:hypothetical protein
MTPPLRLYRRRWTAWFSLPFGVLCCASGAVMGLALLGISHAPMALLMAAIAALFGLAFGMMLIQGALRALRQREPALTMDAEGILYVGKEQLFIPWTAIERVALNEGEGDSMGIWLDTGERRPTAMKRLGRGLQKAFGNADHNIYLGDLVYRLKELEQAVDAFQQKGP